ncbi:hypothetical protein TcasGA2_TC031773 [Tribolium castaneum]|uniref:Uncharacterized protein n=1 Tax=Tribolium castaneum TaxID=7070 RepID=A0A139WNS0_TRICA|nr:hypothetical protein TcasGA2_TC031773 [Tribolium castaneum]
MSFRTSACRHNNNGLNENLAKYTFFNKNPANCTSCRPSERTATPKSREISKFKTVPCENFTVISKRVSRRIVRFH